MTCPVENEEGKICPSPLQRRGWVSIIFRLHSSSSMPRASSAPAHGIPPSHPHMASPLHLHPSSMTDFRPPSVSLPRLLGCPAGLQGPESRNQCVSCGMHGPEQERGLSTLGGQPLGRTGPATPVLSQILQRANTPQVLGASALRTMKWKTQFLPSRQQLVLKMTNYPENQVLYFWIRVSARKEQRRGLAGAGV